MLRVTVLGGRSNLHTFSFSPQVHVAPIFFQRRLKLEWLGRHPLAVLFTLVGQEYKILLIHTLTSRRRSAKSAPLNPIANLTPAAEL